MRKIRIAIDGPAGSGKSTTARMVANELGYTYIDTGAMYRAFTYYVMKNNAINDNFKIAKLLDEFHIELKENGTVLVNEIDITNEIRNPEVSNNVSAIARIKMVRDKMVALQKEMAAKPGIVMEGRDIGTVVIPDAEVKIFLIADLKTRAKRRAMELEKKGIKVDILTLIEEIKKRDEADANRELNPLRKADDAITIDTTKLTLEEQVQKIVNVVKQYYENYS